MNGSSEDEVARLERRCAELEEELHRARARLQTARMQRRERRCEEQRVVRGAAMAGPPMWATTLSKESVLRYARQLLVSALGTGGHVALETMHVTVVGLGGLGSPASMYLAGAGVGRLTLIDCDRVEASNLHRQVIHTEHAVDIEMFKAVSAKRFIDALNSNVQCRAVTQEITPGNALELLAEGDIILDCTDRPSTRFLISDAAVVLGKPVVFGSALRTYGQVALYNYSPSPEIERSACYRCVHKPDDFRKTNTCADNGVLGPVTGVIGCLQAMEVLRVAGGSSQLLVNKILSVDIGATSMFTMRTKRNEKCIACGSNPSITAASFAEGRPEYYGMCTETPQRCEREVDAVDYIRIRQSFTEHVLMDVRESVQFDIGSVPGAISVPLKEIERGLRPARLQAEGGDGTSMQWLRSRLQLSPDDERKIYIVCRRGIDSATAFNLLRDAAGAHSIERIVNVRGGLAAMAKHTDAIPLY